MGKTIFTVVFLLISLFVADKVKTFVKNNNPETNNFIAKPIDIIISDENISTSTDVLVVPKEISTSTESINIEESESTTTDIEQI